MAITTAMCSSFKAECFEATHNFTASTGDTFKMALIKASPTGTYGAATTNYSQLTGASDEASGTGYTAGGFTLTNVTPSVSGTTAMLTFSANPTWTGATFSTDGALLYNSSKGNKAVATFDFGGTQAVSVGTFTITLPVEDAADAILRFT